ncbi:MAG: hypothetical protein O9301_02145 [Leptospira sp.]|nr:hypothetical protein [Leptospira sp.]
MKREKTLIFLSVSILSFFIFNCQTTGYYEEERYRSNTRYMDRGWNDRQFHNPYWGRNFQGNRGYYGVPHYQNHGGSGHNPMHIPGGRYNNIDRPSKWRL